MPTRVRVPPPAPETRNHMIAEKEPGWLVVVHWIAVILSIAGSALVALKLPAVGCGVWVVSNILWLVWTIARRDVPTTIVFIVYEVTAVAGVINWME